MDRSPAGRGNCRRIRRAGTIEHGAAGVAQKWAWRAVFAVIAAVLVTPALLLQGKGSGGRFSVSLVPPSNWGFSSGRVYVTGRPARGAKSFVGSAGRSTTVWFLKVHTYP